MRDNMLLLPKLGQLFCFKHDIESPWLWDNSCRAFSLPKQWNGGHVGVPKQCWGSWPLFLCKHFLRALALWYTFCAQKSRWQKSNYTFSPLIPFSRKQPWFLSKRRVYTTRSQTRGIEWSIQDCARPRDPCLKIRDRDSNFYIESEPKTLPVKNPSPSLKKLVVVRRSKCWKYFELWYAKWKVTEAR